MQGMLVFEAAGTRLAVGVGDVLRLVVEDEVTPVPFGHRALAGLMNVGGDDDVVPVFDLRGLVEHAPRPPRQVRGATVAVIPTPRGLIGLRLDRLLGTAGGYDQADAEAPAELARVIDGAGVALAGRGSAEVVDVPFHFFSTDAFIAALGL